ncbi:hypothetical protein MCZ47_16395 [Bacillus altitudinis]|nr:hypothetical protein [Bacillus altitudinis]MCY7451821.1 hypothetical protein [Bacillus altitudinis]
MKKAIYVCITLSVVSFIYALIQRDYGLALHNGINLVLFAFVKQYYD